MFLILCLILLSSSIAYCAESSQQTLSASLSDILTISKIIVENVEHDRDEPILSINKTSNTYINPNLNVVTLSPIQVKIHTNMSTPISVGAKFQQLNHSENKYNFASNDLSFSPAEITVNSPYDNMIVGDFVPTMNVRTGVVNGLYKGILVFTLGAI